MTIADVCLMKKKENEMLGFLIVFVLIIAIDISVIGLKNEKIKFTSKAFKY